MDICNKIPQRRRSFWEVLWIKLQKTNQTEFRIEKLIKKECDKLYTKRKSHNNLFNSWIDKKILL